MMHFYGEGKKQFNMTKLEPLLKERDIVKILPFIKRENSADLVDSEGTTLLHLSAKYNNQLLINYLICDKNLDANFHVNAVNLFNETPLMSSIQNNSDVSTLKLLLEAGADLWKIKNKSGHSALTMIIQKYSIDSFDNSKLISKVLMDEISNRCSNIVEMVDVLLSAGCKPYHLKVFKNAEVTKLMIQRGCQVNLQNPQDAYDTALHVAAIMNDVENIKVLLEFGADKNIKNSVLRMPIEEAVYGSSPNPEVIKLLWPDNNDWLLKSRNMSAVFEDYPSEVLELLLQHCNIYFSARDMRGKTPLHYLALNHEKPQNFWEFLKNASSEVNTEDYFGRTPLHGAILAGNVKAVRFLLDAGANVNAIDHEGRSPLFYFIFWQNNHRECLELLMQNDADAQLVNALGETVISKLGEANILLNSVLRHLALLESHGSALNMIVLNHINENSFAENSFTKYRSELDEMKRKTIAGSVTYFEFLVDADEKLQKYVKNIEVVKELSKCKNTSYFQQRLIKRFERAMKIKRWRGIAGQLIRECIESLNGYDLVIEIVLDFLHYSDWVLMASTN